MIKIAIGSVLVSVLVVMPGAALGHTFQYNSGFLAGRYDGGRGAFHETCNTSIGLLNSTACDNWIQGYSDGFYTTCRKGVYSGDYNYTLCKGP
jgi:hypothetical protein